MDEKYIVGRNPVFEILDSNRKIHRMWISEGELKGSINKIIEIAESRNIEIFRENRRKLDDLANGKVHQGVVAEVEPFKYSTIKEIVDLARDKNESPFVIILDELQDPHNLGAIIRSAEGAGAHGVIIPERRSVGVTSTVYSASAGAVEHFKIARVTNINQAIKQLKEEGLWIYGADMGGEKYYNTDMKGAVGLVIGNEGKGISRLVKENCDFIVSIPMAGRMESLNASNAASILMYEVVRQNDG